jgi:hypothetical protein
LHANLRIDTDEWQELKVEVDGESLWAPVNKGKCGGNQRRVYGRKIGCWAKAGSLSCSGDVVVTELVR